MFAAFDMTSRHPWLLGLFVLWTGLLFGGFVVGQPDPAGTRRMPAWARLGSSATLVVAAWSWYATARGSGAVTYALLIAIGMTLGLVGDLFMADRIPFGTPIVGGMSAFGLGHVAYIEGILLFTNAHGLYAPAPRWGAWLAWLLVGTVGWYLVLYRGHEPTRLRLAALPYSLLLASTAGVATGAALQSTVFVPLALGGALFLASDLMLALHRFNDAYFYLIDDVVWLAYGPAQMLIVYSVGAALALPAA